MIRPIEMQGVVQRSQDVSAMKQGENTRPAVEQANIQVREEKQIRQKSEQVVKKDETGYDGTKYDAKEKGSNEYEHHGGKNDRKNSEEEDGRVIIKGQNRFDASI